MWKFNTFFLTISTETKCEKMVKTLAHTNITTREVVVYTKFFTQMHVNEMKRREEIR